MPFTKLSPYLSRHFYSHSIWQALGIRQIALLRQLKVITKFKREKKIKRQTIESSMSGANPGTRQKLDPQRSAENGGTSAHFIPYNFWRLPRVLLPSSFVLFPSVASSFQPLLQSLSLLQNTR